MRRVVLRPNVPHPVGAAGRQQLVVLVKVHDDDPPSAVVRVLKDGTATDHRVRRGDAVAVDEGAVTVLDVAREPRPRVDVEVAS